MGKEGRLEQIKFLPDIIQLQEKLLCGLSFSYTSSSLLKKKKAQYLSSLLFCFFVFFCFVNSTFRFLGMVIVPTVQMLLDFLSPDDNITQDRIKWTPPFWRNGEDGARKQIRFILIKCGRTEEEAAAAMHFQRIYREEPANGRSTVQIDLTCQINGGDLRSEMKKEYVRRNHTQSERSFVRWKERGLALAGRCRLLTALASTTHQSSLLTRIFTNQST